MWRSDAVLSDPTAAGTGSEPLCLRNLQGFGGRRDGSVACRGELPQRYTATLGTAAGEAKPSVRVWRISVANPMDLSAHGIIVAEKYRNPSPAPNPDLPIRCVPGRDPA